MLLRVDTDSELLGSTSAAGSDDSRMPLTFPPFHKETTSQAQWYAADERGRVKVHLSAGYNLETGGTTHFVKLVDHVIFSFQPAPLGEFEFRSAARFLTHSPVEVLSS